MITFTIFPGTTHPTLLTGFVECLNTLRLHNPGWSYELVQHDNANLQLVDLTTCHSFDEMTAEDHRRISHPETWRVLVLLNSRQRGLARELLRTRRCSLLCVDEQLLRLRELVECSLKKRRYISSFFTQMSENAPEGRLSAEFTHAEIKIINALRCGKNGVEISNELFRSQKTISTHKRRIMKKLGVVNNMQLREAIMNMSFTE